MAFNKVVKAPAKLAHIRNCPRKKSEGKRQRIEVLLDYAKTLVPAILLHQGSKKLYLYAQLSDVKQELKALGFYDEQAMWYIISRARWEHKRFHQW